VFFDLFKIFIIILGFTAMFAQGDTPCSSASNLVNPGIVFEFMSAGPGRQLARARCPVLLVAAKEDDNVPPRVASEMQRRPMRVSYYLSNIFAALTHVQK
jgi:hypothetical protein